MLVEIWGAVAEDGLLFDGSRHQIWCADRWGWHNCKTMSTGLDLQLLDKKECNETEHNVVKPVPEGGSSQNTLRKPTQTHREHVNATQKDSSPAGNRTQEPAVRQCNDPPTGHLRKLCQDFHFLSHLPILLNEKTQKCRQHICNLINVMLHWERFFFTLPVALWDLWAISSRCLLKLTVTLLTLWCSAGRILYYVYCLTLAYWNANIR